MKITRRQLNKLISEVLEEGPPLGVPRLPPVPPYDDPVEYAPSLANRLAHQILMLISRSGGTRSAVADMLLGIFNDLGGEPARKSLQTLIDHAQEKTDGRFLEK